MPKKKKTRKQKILADRRHKAALVERKIEYKPIPHTNKPQLNQGWQTAVQAVSVDRYHYIRSDLFKTVVLTLSIIAGELLLGYLFR